MRVHVVSVGQRHSVPRRLLTRAALTALRATRAPREAELEVALVGDATMARVNQRYHGRRSTTDVLSFPAEPGRDHCVIGEVVISLPRARAQARQRGHPIRHEVALLLIHGVLHLRGYDDRTPKGAARMHARAEAIVRRTIGQRRGHARRRAPVKR